MPNNSDDTLEMRIKPIGYINSGLEKPGFRHDPDIIPERKKKQNIEYYKSVKDSVSKLILKPQYIELLDGIEDFSHIVVIYWPHLIPDEEREIKKVHPMGRKYISQKGIFATRSPARPNPILISTVRLIERKNDFLKVKGLEALNGSPLIDIKPFTRYDDTKTAVFPDWLVKLHAELEEN